MKKQLSLIALVLIITLLGASCNKKTNNITSSASSGSNQTISDDMNSSGGIVSDDNSQGANSQNNSSSTTSSGKNVDNTDYSGDKIVVEDLGTMYLASYPVDDMYDWGHSVMKDGDTYKMWWTRQSPYDTIWYAESKDLKNWYNEQRVLKVTNNTQWIKMHVAKPTVVKANGKYFMYFETPATLDNGREYDNNVLLATSTDGIHFNYYPSNDNPQPIIKQPASSMNKGVYGVGQPSAFYKDGTFYLYYTDAVSGDGFRVATSKDGINFGDYASHPRVVDRAACGVKYNSRTKKFMMMYTLSPYILDKSKSRNENVYYMESDDGKTWPYKTVAELLSNPNIISNSSTKIRSYPDFVTNTQGIVDTATMYAVYMQGELAAVGKDWKDKYYTWDGHITAINPKLYTKKTITLPNGKDLNAETLKTYADTKTGYNKQSSTAKKLSGGINIDGIIDGVWNNTPDMTVSRIVTNWGALPTKTTATVKALWDNDNLYLLAVIKDSAVSTKYAISNDKEIWHHDSVDFFIDVPNDDNGTEVPLELNQYYLSVDADARWVVKGKSDTNMKGDFSGAVIKTKRTADGYVIEAKLPWYDFIKTQIASNKTIGFDIQINDDQGSGDRTAMVAWNDSTGNAFQFRNLWGDLKLVD